MFVERKKNGGGRNNDLESNSVYWINEIFTSDSSKRDGNNGAYRINIYRLPLYKEDVGSKPAEGYILFIILKTLEIPGRLTPIILFKKQRCLPNHVYVLNITFIAYIYIYIYT